MNNKMREIKIEKIVLNIGCGTTTKLEDAKIILEKISGRTVVITKTKKRSTFNVPKNKPIGCKVTIRKGKEELLSKLLVAKENSLSESSFDRTGNFSFGIKEYIDIPGVEYEPKIGMLGFDVCVSLERSGYRTKRKKISSSLGKKHSIKKEDALNFMKEKFKVNVINERIASHE